MKCEDVQLILWSGVRSPEAEAHVEQCAVCRAEVEDIKQIVGKLTAIDVPAPSKRLTPSKQVIHHTVKKNRIRRTLRSSSVAAGLTVLLATGATLGWQQLQDAGFKSAEQSAPPLASQPAPPVSEDRQAPVQDQLKKEQTVSALDVTVAPNAQLQKILTNAQVYLMKSVNVQEVRKITILSFTPDRPFTADDANTPHLIHGQFELDVDLQPGAVTPFRQGVQKVDAELSGTSVDASIHFMTVDWAAKTPAELVTLWGTAQQQRSGVHELALFTPEQQEARRQNYIDSNWSIGYSSPWVTGTKLISQTDNGNDQMQAEVEVSMATSTGPAEAQKAYLTMTRNANGIWQLLRVDNGKKDAFPTQSVDLADGRTLTTDSSLPTEWEGASVRLETNSVQNGPEGQMLQSVYGNNAQPLEQEVVQTPLGDATLALVQTEQPAASGSMQTTKEYWLTVFSQDTFHTDRQYALTIIFGMKDDADAAYRKENLLKVAASWRVTE